MLAIYACLWWTVRLCTLDKAAGQPHAVLQRFREASIASDASGLMVLAVIGMAPLAALKSSSGGNLTWR